MAGVIGDRAAEVLDQVKTVQVTDSLPEPGDVELIVICGSEESAYDDSVPWLAKELAWTGAAIAAGTPVMGICFGGQLLARALGATLRRAAQLEWGWTELETDDPVLIPPGPWMEFHYDVFDVPPGATEVARTTVASQAFVQGPHLGLQFHPEVNLKVFDGWVQGWEQQGALDRIARKGVNLARLRAEVAEHNDRATAAGTKLFDTYWDRARSLGPRGRDRLG
jgi:GMP synthase-like glutamine amidotransferase